MKHYLVSTRKDIVPIMNRFGMGTIERQDGVNDFHDRAGEFRPVRGDDRLGKSMLEYSVTTPSEIIRANRMTPVIRDKRARVADRSLRYIDIASTSPLRISRQKPLICLSPETFAPVPSQKRAEVEEILTMESPIPLFACVLDRAERRHGIRLVREISMLLCTSRRGLTLDELTTLTGENFHDINHALHSLRNHLVKDGECHQFLHDYMRAAIARRYFTGEEEWRLLHRRLADFFSRLDLTERRLDEEPWHLAAARCWSELHALITQPPVSMLMEATGRSNDLIGYRNLLDEISYDDYLLNRISFSAGNCLSTGPPVEMLG